MAIRASKYYGATGTTSGYNNPELGQAASNISKMFSGIPDSSDVRNATEAKATAERAGRLAQLFTDAGMQGVDQAKLDRQAAIAGAYNPNQSLTAVGMNNTVDLQKNTADNNRALKQTELTQQGENIRAITAPLAPGHTRAAGLGRFYGRGDMPENTQGGVTLSEGQTYTGPNGFTAAGTPRPLTEAEMKARILAGLPAGDQRAAVLSGVGVETAQGPDGKPVFVNRSDAAGMQPQGPDLSARVMNYGTPDGKKGLAVPNRDGKVFDAQTGAELPAQAQVYSAQAAGTPDQLGGKTTEAQDKYGLTLKMTDEPSRIIENAFAGGQLPTVGDGVLRSISAAAPGAVAPLIEQGMTPEARNLYSAITNALPYQLLALSGQGVTEAEYARTMARLVPSASDTPEQLSQKRNQFSAFRQAIQGLAGGAAQKVGMDAPPAVAPGVQAPQPAPTAGPDPGQTVMPPLGAPVPPAQQGQLSATAGAPAAPAPPPAAPISPSPQAVQHLKANPGLSPAFDAKYGPGAAAGILGTR